MKLKITSLLVAAFSIFPLISSAQEKAPASPAAEAKPWVPSTPLEKKAKAMLQSMKKIPAIMSSIKDQATLDKASTSMIALNKEIDTHVEDIKKLPVPDNATRNSIGEKMEKESASLGPSMQKAMMGMASLAPELMPKLQEMMMGFGANMEKHEADMNKYFETDADRKKKAGK